MNATPAGAPLTEVCSGDAGGCGSLKVSIACPIWIWLVNYLHLHLHCLPWDHP